MIRGKMSAVPADSVVLVTSDGATYGVPLDVARRSVTIRNMIDDLGDDADVGEIPLVNVDSKTLDDILNFLEKFYADKPENPDPKSLESLKDTWATRYSALDQAVLFNVILAANYLDIKDLLDVACKAVANMIKGKTPEEIRRTFNIKNDFTPEEEEQIRKENEWVEEH